MPFPFFVIFTKKFEPFIVSFHFFPPLYSCNLLSTLVELQPRDFFCKLLPQCCCGFHRECHQGLSGSCHFVFDADGCRVRLGPRSWCSWWQAAVMMNPFTDPCRLATIPHAFPREMIYVAVAAINLLFSNEKKKCTSNTVAKWSRWASEIWPHIFSYNS